MFSSSRHEKVKIALLTPSFRSIQRKRYTILTIFLTKRLWPDTSYYPVIIISFYFPSISKLFSFFIVNSFPILRVDIALHVIYFHFYCFPLAYFTVSFSVLFYRCCKFWLARKNRAYTFENDARSGGY